jgi:hypothetical protein
MLAGVRWLGRAVRNTQTPELLVAEIGRGTLTSKNLVEAVPGDEDPPAKSKARKFALGDEGVGMRSRDPEKFRRLRNGQHELIGMGHVRYLF